MFDSQSMEVPEMGDESIQRGGAIDFHCFDGEMCVAKTVSVGYNRWNPFTYAI